MAFSYRWPHGISPAPLPVIPISGPLVWNLLFYESFDLAQNDPTLRGTIVNPLQPPQPFLGVVVEPVAVFQFGTQSAGYWVMVVCDITDPTSFSARLALQYFPDAKYLNWVNFTFIQDLEGLKVSGFFSDGLP